MVSKIWGLELEPVSDPQIRVKKTMNIFMLEQIYVLQVGTKINLDLYSGYLKLPMVTFIELLIIFFFTEIASPILDAY